MGGFSTIELAVSLALFLFLSAFISLSIARALSATTEARAVRSAEAAASDSLAQLSTVSYEDLVAGTFTVPEPCDDNSGVGVRSTTCTTLGNIPVTISYAYIDVSVGSTTPECNTTISTGTRTATSLGYVGLCASVITVGGSPAPDSLAPAVRRINSPSPKYAPDGGVVRVSVGGDAQTLPSKTLYLVKADNPARIMGSGAIESDNIAYIATTGATTDTPPTAACVDSSPCMIVSTPIDSITSSPAVSGTRALYGQGARPSAGITTPRGVVRDVGISVAQPPTLRMDASAVNGDSVARAAPSVEDGVPTITNTICVYASFDDAGSQSAQICNDNPNNPSVLSTSTYELNGNLWPLPASQVTVTIDHPSGRCSAGTQRGYTAGGSGGTTAGNVCTSWTWGSPDTLPAQVNLTSGAIARAPLTWVASDTGVANPSAGWPTAGTTLWAHPRAFPDCAVDGTCSTVTKAPELTWCPGDYCRNGRPRLPELLAPSGPVIRGAGDTTAFVAAAVNKAGPRIYAYQLAHDEGGTAVVPFGTLKRGNGTTVQRNQSLASTTAGGNVQWTYSYDRPAGQNSPTRSPVRVKPTSRSRSTLREQPHPSPVTLLSLPVPTVLQHFPSR